MDRDHQILSIILNPVNYLRVLGGRSFTDQVRPNLMDIQSTGLIDQIYPNHLD